MNGYCSSQPGGQKLSDGKMIGRAGRLTDSRVNSLQNYYGDVIRRNKRNLEAMIKAVQASLLDSNSSDDNHLCPQGEKSWFKWQVTKRDVAKNLGGTGGLIVKTRAS